MAQLLKRVRGPDSRLGSLYSSPWTISKVMEPSSPTPSGVIYTAVSGWEVVLCGMGQLSSSPGGPPALTPE